MIQIRYSIITIFLIIMMICVFKAGGSACLPLAGTRCNTYSSDTGIYNGKTYCKCDACDACDAGFFVDESEIVCCDNTKTNCRECTADGTVCTLCATPYHKNSSTGTCQLCTEQVGCKLCLNTYSCYECINSSYLVAVTLSKCMPCDFFSTNCIDC